MAFTIAALSGSSALATSGTTLATPSVTLTSGKAYILWVVNGLASAANTPTCTGWTQIRSRTNGGGQFRLTAFRRDGNGSTGAHTIDFGGQAQLVAHCWIDEITDSELGSGLVVQSADNYAAPITVTLSALASESNKILCGATAPSEYVTFSEEAGFTVVTRRQSSATLSSGSMERTGSDATPPTPTWTVQYGSDGAGIALEIAAATGDPNDSLTVTTQPSTVDSGDAITPSVVVESSDTGSTATVTATIASGGGSLSGTTAVAMVAGVATFSNLIVTGSGSHTLAFNATGHDEVVSSSFTVNSGGGGGSVALGTLAFFLEN